MDSPKKRLLRPDAISVKRDSCISYPQSTIITHASTHCQAGKCYYLAFKNGIYRKSPEMPICHDDPAGVGLRWSLRRESM